MNKSFRSDYLCNHLRLKIQLRFFSVSFWVKQVVLDEFSHPK